MVNVAAEVESATKILERAATRLREALDAAGGRGVEVANELDRVQFAIDSLKGELGCPHCQAVLTSGRDEEED